MKNQNGCLIKLIPSIATLEQFSIEGRVKGSKKGPTVTRYEIALEPGVNVKRVSGIQDNLMMNLSSKSFELKHLFPGNLM
jgi:DNA segregation ATPase FtsK/SpoIIIE, S-DNA-T family